LRNETVDIESRHIRCDPCALLQLLGHGFSVMISRVFSLHPSCNHLLKYYLCSLRPWLACNFGLLLQALQNGCNLIQLFAKSSNLCTYKWPPCFFLDDKAFELKILSWKMIFISLDNLCWFPHTTLSISQMMIVNFLNRRYYVGAQMMI